jgi:hypothetical protein
MFLIELRIGLVSSGIAFDRGACARVFPIG